MSCARAMSTIRNYFGASVGDEWMRVIAGLYRRRISSSKNSKWAGPGTLKTPCPCLNAPGKYWTVDTLSAGRQGSAFQRNFIIFFRFDGPATGAPSNIYTKLSPLDSISNRSTWRWPAEAKSARWTKCLLSVPILVASAKAQYVMFLLTAAKWPG